MSQQEKVPATKLTNLSLITVTHKVKGEIMLPQVVL